MVDAKIRVTAEDGTSRVLAQVRNSLEQTSSVAAKVGSALGLMGVLSVGGVMAIAKASIDGVDALNDLKDATGASIENISALEDVAARTGTSFETVQSALIKFNKVLQDAKPDSPTEAALKAIGLSAKELKDMDPAEALRVTAVALSGFADDGNKARLTQELFGKSLKDVAPFLKDLSEQGKLVATVTTEQAEEAEKLNKQLFELQKNTSDAARSLASRMVPAINAVIDAMKKGGLRSGLDELGKQLFDWEGNASRKNIKWLSDDLKDLREEQAAVTIDIFGKKGQIQTEIDAKTAALEAAQKAYFKITSLQGGRGNVNPASVPPTIGDIPDKPKKSSGKSEAEKDQEREQNERIRLGRAAAIADGKAVEDANDSYATSLAKTVHEKERLLATFEKELLAYSDSNLSLRQQIEEIGLTKEAVNALRLARLDAAIDDEQRLVAAAAQSNADQQEIDLIQRKIKLLQEQRTLTARGQIAQASADTAKEQQDAAKDYAKTLQTDVKGALSNAFRDSKDPIGAFGDALGNIVYTRIASALAESLTSSLFSGTASSSGGGGFLAGALAAFGFDGGGYTGNAPRAGGLDGKGGFMAMMHPQETVIDHTKGQTTGSSQSIVVHQNFTVGDVASISMVRQAVSGSERRIAATMGRSMNYGGALA
ncbi:MAG: hypothetical protein Q7K57_57185 [Burkholderiaceae bacterium]|nr:hypothetical protein [Burkholderiaceae bacterium]